jgi:diguanylate cyclase (GGDEF)-like protein
LRSALRNSRDSQDFVARYGGEEFAVLLDKCSQSDALAVSERLRQTVSDLAITHTARPDARGIVTVSLGIAVSSHRSETIAQALGRADAALYEAKRQGRDRSVLAHEDAEWVVAQLRPVPEPVAETGEDRVRNREPGQ